jgi:hypothetical protein
MDGVGVPFINPCAHRVNALGSHERQSSLLLCMRFGDGAASFLENAPTQGRYSPQLNGIGRSQGHAPAL